MGRERRLLHDQLPLHPDEEVAGKRAQIVVRTGDVRHLEGDLDGLAGPRQTGFGNDLILELGSDEVGLASVDFSANVVGLSPSLSSTKLCAMAALGIAP